MDEPATASDACVCPAFRTSSRVGTTATDWRRAAASYRTALALALVLESEGRLVGTDATLPVRIRNGLAGCERALTAGGARGQR